MDLEALRAQISAIDEQLVPLFLQRMQASLAVAKYKQETGKPVLDKTRERTVLKRACALTDDADMQMYVRLLYSHIFSLSRSYQHAYLSDLTAAPIARIRASAQRFSMETLPQTAVVACQGVEGAYASLACERLFQNPDILFFKDWESVFSAVEQGMCRYGILPIENSTAGSVNQVYDLMTRYQFYIVKSLRLKVEHSLLANSGASLAGIREIFSHEQAVHQCSRFLKTLPDCRVTVCENTAAAAKRVAKSGRTDVAAIAAPACGALYGLQALQTEIQDFENNYTRFICIGKELEIFSGANKTSLMLTLPNRPGALYDVLSRFNALGVNLLKLESRPKPTSDREFTFYFDLEASVYDTRFLQMLAELESTAEAFSYLGSYTELL